MKTAILFLASIAVMAQSNMTNGLPIIFGSPATGDACVPGPAVYKASSGELYSCQEGFYALIPATHANVQTYFFIDTTSDVSPYKNATYIGNYVPATKASVSVAVTGTAEVQSWITPVTFPGITLIPMGTAHIHIHANRLATGSGAVTVTPALYTRTVGGVETLIATFEESANLTTTEAELDLQGVILHTVGVVATDRIVVKFNATAAATRTVVLSYDGTASNETFARLELPVTAAVVTAINPETVFYSNGFIPTSLASASGGSGSDIAGVNDLIRVGSLDITQPTTLTGISFLVGATASTGKAVVTLYDAAGVLLANSNTAGTTVGTPAVFQAVPFTAQLQVTRPGRYFIGVSVNGNATSLRLQVAGVKLCGNVVQTFGTPVAITPPTSFNTLTAPVAATY